MDWPSLGWKLAGLALIAGGVFLLANRRYREKIARRYSDYHGQRMERWPWLYGPKPLRDRVFSEAGWQRLIIGWAIAVVLIGVVWMLLPTSGGK